jgi:hypothetical protein
MCYKQKAGHTENQCVVGGHRAKMCTSRIGTKRAMEEHEAHEV